MFELLSKATWPKVIWMTPHAPRILKTPFHVHVQPENIQLFNQRVRVLMEKNSIPTLNFFTEGVTSYDRTHYSKGVNGVKANIFLNYVLENRKQLVDNDIIT